jgi:sugar phosphate isomerase/epimerase
MMKPCISQATTLSSSFEEDLLAYAGAGWTAVELWLTKVEEFVEKNPRSEAKSRIAESGLVAVAASFQGGLLLSREPERAAHWDHFQRRLDLLADLGVPTLVLAADYPAEAGEDDYARAGASLARAGERAGGMGIRLALEFQKTSRFCSSLDTAVALIESTKGSGVGICLDLFHFYTGPSKFEDLAYLSRENLAWVQVCDLSGVPREIASDADRILPGEGDFSLAAVFEAVAQIGYDGYVSLELMNPMLWQSPASHVADVGLRALGRCLSSGVNPSHRHHQRGDSVRGK